MYGSVLCQQIATSDTITLHGCTNGVRVVDIYMDGNLATPIGNATAASSGIWTFSTTQTSGIHYFSAKDRTSGSQSANYYVQFP